MTYSENITRILIALIKSAVTEDELPADIDFESQYNQIMKLALLHEVSHLAALALIRSGRLKDTEQIKTAEKQIYKASFRDTKNSYTLELASSVFQAEKIPFIALKGAVIKNYYPEKWMRSSCDIDVLVPKKDFERAVKILQNNEFVIDGNLNYHDISMLYDGTNLELHFSVCENIKNIDVVLSKIWDYAHLKSGLEYEENHDFFVFHHIAHMSYHFLAGGCGIRPFLDLWILRRSHFFDEESVRKLCNESRISEFYDGVNQLIDVWFEGKAHNDITRRIEKYIMTGGAYGTYPNNAAAYTIKHGGKIRHIVSIAFPPYTNMRVLYPVLNRIPVLLPFCYIYRVFQKTVGRGNDRAIKKYKIIKEQDAAFVKEVASLMKALRLDGK